MDGAGQVYKSQRSPEMAPTSLSDTVASSAKVGVACGTDIPLHQCDRHLIVLLCIHVEWSMYSTTNIFIRSRRISIWWYGWNRKRRSSSPFRRSVSIAVIRPRRNVLELSQHHPPRMDPSTSDSIGPGQSQRHLRRHHRRRCGLAHARPITCHSRRHHVHCVRLPGPDWI